MPQLVTLPNMVGLDLTRVGQEIRAERRRQGVTQAQLARRVGRDQTSLSAIELGQQSLDAVLLDRIARELLGARGLGIVLMRAGAIDLDLPGEELIAAAPDLSPDSKDLLRRFYRRLRAVDTGGLLQLVGEGGATSGAQ